LQPLFLKPGAEVEQSVCIELFQLVQQDETALRVNRSYDSRGGNQLISAAHAVPLLPVVGQLAVFNGEAGKGKLGRVEECVLVVPDILQFCGQLLVLLRVVGCILLRLFPVAVGANLNVDLLDLLKTALDFLSAFILQIEGVFLRDFEICFQLCELLLRRSELALEQGNVCGGFTIFVFDLVCAHPFALIFSVSGENVLLLPDQVQSRYKLFRSCRIEWKLIGILTLTVGILADHPAPVVDIAFFCLQLVDAVADADHLQQSVRFLAV